MLYFPLVVPNVGDFLSTLPYVAVLFGFFLLPAEIGASDG